VSGIVGLMRDVPSVFVAVVALFGLIVGSFLNVVIHRLPRMLERSWRQQCAEFAADGGDAPVAREPRYDLVHPPSHCPQCRRPIGPLENIPLVSWLAQRGRCKGCGTRISARYPLVEAITALLSGCAAAHFGFGLAAAAALPLVWALVALTFIDLDTQLLPDDITLPLVWLGLLANIFHAFTDLQSAVVGAVAGYLALWSVYWLFKLTTGKEGMGYGDFKLLAALGAWLGWQMLPLVILGSSVVGAVVGIALIALRHGGRSVPIPFGPYLACAGLVALFYGTELTRLYLGTLL
jgi:leader peptidase (prepilin peptidase) / N-methyltransferase